MKGYFLIFLFFCSYSSNADEGLINIGKRLFEDFRFAQQFYQESKANVNYRLNQGSVELDEILVNDKVYDSPFKGQTYSCASCHMSNEFKLDDKIFYRGHNDFAQLTKVPFRDDFKTHTLRNTISLTGIGSKWTQNRFSHYDGELKDHADTVLGNFTGRNMGWKTDEKSIALSNIIKVLREDDGMSDFARKNHGSYKKLLLGIDPSIPSNFRLNEKNRLNVEIASNDQIISFVVKAVSSFMDTLDFKKDSNGDYIGSAYDKFLKLNNLPRSPQNGENIYRYAGKLRSALYNLKDVKYIPGEFEQDQWKGLRVFFNLNKQEEGGRGMCLPCHVPPMFTDQSFHNIGVSQIEYEKIHGEDSFKEIEIPSLENRNDQTFLDRASLDDKKLTDLGVWNFYKRKDHITRYMNELFCRNPLECNEALVLENLVANFKTPTLRNLKDSAPYFHDGSAKDLMETLIFYKITAKIAQANKLVKPAHQIRMIRLDDNDLIYLREFLKALDDKN